MNIDKQALREEFLNMQDHYSDPADRERQEIYIAAEELLDELEAAEHRIAEQSAIVAAAEKLVRCKGRYHSELNYRALAKLFGVITPDLPPLEHENVQCADAAEVEITALRQRIVELESKLSKPVLLPKTNGYWDEQEKAYEEAITLAKRQVRLAGFRCEGDE
ncbi:ead/Ea22-like family protein [Salmonella enterica subsp. enterica serovar Weltevreden]|uniref:Ead/Ea22-like family protein n=1 Tax=Salmonella enterica subsp. enterica serovar Weltevreden TaxID=57743 RepID=A0A5W7CUR1_SALET|nr:ead/Ea22-like family protein [Salmonella enterica subsp. enterica serovar Weltevreden]EAB2378319.1 ead/Ea22-like family protein [Salmonella enterica]ECB0692705.1 ead/Ea22-like family protein [Salmonella enterica subsp. enterica serovar Poona]ECC3548288.1 ead/Ea22-like family protein [Salmonella enterica subsp. enterica]EAS1643197.1 ead/Ea22-like family protein [Salmonella enterica]